MRWAPSATGLGPGVAWLWGLLFVAFVPLAIALGTAHALAEPHAASSATAYAAKQDLSGVRAGDAVSRAPPTLTLPRLRGRVMDGSVAGSGFAVAAKGVGAVNRVGRGYPTVLDPRTGKAIPHPGGGLSKVPVSERVPWGAQERGGYIKEWYDRGYSTPEGGWSGYDIHTSRRANTAARTASTTWCRFRGTFTRASSTRGGRDY